MAVTIVAITGFQVYWINKTYEREERNLDMRTNMLFRETMRGLQVSKLKLDKLASDSVPPGMALIRGEVAGRKIATRLLSKEKMTNILEVVMQRSADSAQPRVFLRKGKGDSLEMFNQSLSPRQSRIMQFLFDVDSLQDSIRVRDVETAYAKKLAEQKLDVPFRVSRVETRDSGRPSFNEVTLGFSHPITYRLNLGRTFPLLLKRISSAVLFSVFLVGFTVLSFLLLYRNLLRQRKLADIKNEFISNITHELKTPIATVSVAIEALRNFSASMDPQKTREYLDISANELQRLSLLVDKVLKLSMFEKQKVELNPEPVNLRQLVDEVTASMRLQFEKRKAVINVRTEGDTTLAGDRLHLVSVLFNLLDNALKYTPGRPVIDIDITETGNDLQLSVADNGVGISPEYRRRIFEKFFRVPHGDVHNAKGYGLGLSYVAHVAEQHKGSIWVEEVVGGGSRFVVTLPKNQASRPAEQATLQKAES